MLDLHTSATTTTLAVSWASIETISTNGFPWATLSDEVLYFQAASVMSYSILHSNLSSRSVLAMRVALLSRAKRRLLEPIRLNLNLDRLESPYTSTTA